MKLFAAHFTMLMPNGTRRPAVFKPIVATCAVDARFRLGRMVEENGATVADAMFTEIENGDADAARAAKIDGGDEPEHLGLGCASLSHLPGANEPLALIGQTNGGREVMP